MLFLKYFEKLSYDSSGLYETVLNYFPSRSVPLGGDQKYKSGGCNGMIKILPSLCVYRDVFQTSSASFQSIYTWMVSDAIIYFPC